MLSNVVASSEELDILARVLDDHCAAHGVTDLVRKSAIARTLIELFGSGIDSEEGLRAGLLRTADQTEIAA